MKTETKVTIDKARLTYLEDLERRTRRLQKRYLDELKANPQGVPRKTAITFLTRFLGL